MLGGVLSLLARVPVWAWALAALLAWGGWQRHQAKASAAELASQQAQAAQAREVALQANITETQRRLRAQHGVTQDAQAQLDQVRAARLAADRMAARLRAQLAAGHASAGADHPATAADCEAASARSRVLAELLGRADDRAGSLAAAADAARIAGQACERSYDALTGGPGWPRQAPITPESMPR